ncbi:hypothetical protein M1563_02095 [Patescibacteria group bacterium]|nr:hypothetical protein [Patescibacteria group bacterium]MCL5410095.1 hypothetical protein [Patescibacteria group bacterium]
MPEDSNPNFPDELNEDRLVYFTLPMSLNYQRDSYKLWQAALSTYKDEKTKDIFSIKNSARMSGESLRKKLLKYKLALQPNKHLSTWKAISKTINGNWGSLEYLFTSADYDFLRLKELVQNKHKKDFPYLSGPKIFNYWCFIISTYGKVKLANRQYISIVPDTHIIKCSIKLGVITNSEALRLSREEISNKWRALLKNSNIDPIDMHPPLWFWSRNNFQFKLNNL